MVDVPDVEGQLEEGEDAEEHLEGVEVESQGPAADEVGAGVVEARAEAERGLGPCGANPGRLRVG